MVEQVEQLEAHDRKRLFLRRHPDIFTREEAAVYLGLPSAESFDRAREDYKIPDHRPTGKHLLFWRDELDAAALRMFGKDVAGTTRRAKP